MDFKTYIRKPFEVEAIEVTKDNIKDLARQFKIGKVKYSDDGVPFILVDQSRVPNVEKVWPGYYVTKVGRTNVRCYTHKIFFSQFVQTNTEIDAWVRFINGRPAKNVPLPEAAVAEG